MTTRRQFMQLASATGILLGTSARFAGRAEAMSKEEQKAITPAQSV